MVPDLDPDKPDPDPVWPDLDPAISGSGSGLPGSRSGNIRIWIWLLPDPRFPMDYPVRFRLYTIDRSESVSLKKVKILTTFTNHVTALIQDQFLELL